MNDILENEILDESKIKVIENYSVILKNVLIKENKTKFGVFYTAVVSLIDGNEIETKCKPKLVKAIKILQNYGKNAITKKEIVKEISGNEDSKKEYLCIKLTLANGKPYRCFIDNEDELIIETIFEDYKTKNTKKEK